MSEQAQQQEMPLEQQEQQKEQPQQKPKENDIVVEYSKKIKEFEKANAELQRKLEENERNKLVNENNYKELYELEKNKNEEITGKFDAFKNSWLSDKKLSVLKEEARKLGIRKEALQDLELLDHDVQIEATSLGNINVIGAEAYMQNLKAKRPHWFGQQGAPNFNNGGENTPPASKTLDPAEILKLQKTDPAAYKKHMAELIAKKNGR